jgi:hypothetical protein
MREVVKKEVLKLYQAGIIYPVPHSEWVSLVQVVPKKGGMKSLRMKRINSFLNELSLGGECA